MVGRVQAGSAGFAIVKAIAAVVQDAGSATLAVHFEHGAFRSAVRLGGVFVPVPRGVLMQAIVEAMFVS